MDVADEITHHLSIPRSLLESFSLKWGIVELALFGSVLREDFRPDSDVDVLVSFAPGKTPSLLSYVEMQSELSEVMGRPVDALTRAGVERSENPIRRKAILSSARIVYAAS